MNESPLSITQRHLDQHGWAVVGVGADPEEGEAAFAYTVGLQHQFSAPDLLIIGLPFNIAHDYFKKAVDLLKAGERLKLGMNPGFFGDYAGWLIEIDPEKYGSKLVMADSLFPNMRRGCQMVFPDAKGRFPWEKESTYYGRVTLLGPIEPSDERHDLH